MSKYKYLIIALGVVLGTFVVFMTYLNLGCSYSGTEFSPDDFTIRQFSYQYEPNTDWVVSGRQFKKDYYQSMPTLVADKYIKPVYKKEKTWHLLQDNGYYYRGHSADSDARLLVDFLGLLDENHENKWTTWNSEHPKLAKIFWPLIADMARDEAYLTVGDVLTFALDSENLDPKQFEADLQQEVAKAYLKLGTIDFENDAFGSAENRIKKSLEYHSDSEAKSLLKRIRSAKPLAEEPVSGSESE